MQQCLEPTMVDVELWSGTSWMSLPVMTLIVIENIGLGNGNFAVALMKPRAALATHFENGVANFAEFPQDPKGLTTQEVSHLLFEIHSQEPSSSATHGHHQLHNCLYSIAEFIANFLHLGYHCRNKNHSKRPTPPPQHDDAIASQK